MAAEMDISDWRAKIDTVDQILVDLVNRRLEFAIEIGRIKRTLSRGRNVSLALNDALNLPKKPHVDSGDRVDLFARNP